MGKKKKKESKVLNIGCCFVRSSQSSSAPCDHIFSKIYLVLRLAVTHRVARRLRLVVEARLLVAPLPALLEAGL